MAIEGSVCIEFIDGHTVGKRGLAWLIIKPPDRHITAKKVFTGLKANSQRNLRNRFDHWLGGGICDKYFHGWREPEYKDCFVFKLQDLRLFGFLCNPRENEPEFRLCVLASHSTKEGWEADKSEKDRMNILKNNEKVIKALKNIKEDCSKEKNEYELDRKKH